MLRIYTEVSIFSKSTFIEAPSSTKNKDKKRDPEAHSAKKGNAWHFGYRAHVGVDHETGIVHSLRTCRHFVRQPDRDLRSGFFVPKRLFAWYCLNGFFSKYAFRVYLYNLFVIRIFVIERFCDNLYYIFAISKQNNKIIKKQHKNCTYFKMILVSNAQKTHSSLGKKQMEKI